MLRIPIPIPVDRVGIGTVTEVVLGLFRKSRPPVLLLHADVSSEQQAKTRFTKQCWVHAAVQSSGIEVRRGAQAGEHGEHSGPSR